MATKREALITSAEKSLQKGKVDAALKDYLKVLEETPADINILNKIGDLQVRLGRNDESITYFLRIAEHYARDGFYVRAIAMYKKINKLDPARLDIYEKLAELYVKQQLWMEAKSNYQVLADYLFKQDNLGGTIGIYQKMVAIEPQNLQLHVKLADLFTQAKRIPEALREYAVVAGSLAERGANEESIRVYEKALRLAPDNVEILRMLVPLLLSINSVDQARAVLRKGLEASPRSVPLFLLYAEAALAANDMAEARSFSDKARAVEPENEDVLAAVVKIQLKGRRPDLAWAAAAPLAEAAVRRGEAKKALALLVPIARAAPDVDELVKKIVDVASSIGDEATALPFRSALAELYRKKGKLAEAADLLRHCSRVQPDNAEFRSRLSQLEPQVSAVSVAPQRVPPSSVERKMEVTLSGFEAAVPRAATPAPPAPPPPVVAPEPEEAVDEFEFDLDDAEVAEAPGPMIAAEVLVPSPPPTPPRGFAAPPPTPARGLASTAQAGRAEDRDEFEPSWGSLSAREALDAYEARQAEAARTEPPQPAFRHEEIEELQPEAEVQPEAARFSISTEFPALDLALEPPPGFGPAIAAGSEAFPGADLESLEGSAVAWPSTMFPEPEPVVAEEAAGPPSFGALPRPASGDTALDDALVEADVFRRYGLLEKAVDQLRPWIERAPGNLKVREKLFEICLEQGNRAAAREQAEILAEAYGTTGREDRIRGLEGLLGEPLREAPPEQEEPAAVFGEPLAGEFVLAGTEGEETPAEKEAVAEEALAVAFSEEPAQAELSLEAGARPAEPVEPAETPAFVSQALEEPPTEVISAMPAVTPAEPAVAGEELVAAASQQEAPLEFAETSAEKSSSEALTGLERPGPAGVELPPTSESGGEPVPETVVELEEPIVPFVPEGRAKPRPKLSAEDVLGMGKGQAAPPTKRVRTVRPEDVELDLLGAKAPRAKPKKEASAGPALPDDLLRSLRKPSVAPSPAPAPAPDEPAALSEQLAEPARAEFEPVESAEALFAGEIPEHPVVPDVVAAREPPLDLVVSVPLPARPSPEELSELDFCLDQGMVVDAAERLQSLEGRFPADPDLAARRLRLEGGRGGADASRASLHDILSDDLDSVLDAELGKALTEDMVRDSPSAASTPPAIAAGSPSVDDSGLFSDEQEFFNFADELHTELRRDVDVASVDDGEGREVSLEEIFRDFKKGVEQQLSPEDFETHYNLGIAYKEMGLTDEAIGEFQLAAKDPLHAVECCAMLGLCFLEKGLPQLAVKWYRKGLETIGIKEDDRLGIQYALAGVHEQVGDREAAYRTYLEIFGSNAGYRDVPERLKELKPFVAS